MRTQTTKITRKEAKEIISNRSGFIGTDHNRKMVANELRMFIAGLHNAKPKLI